MFLDAPGATRVPAIPNPGAANFDAAVKEAIEVLYGRRGDYLDQALSYRDAIAIGITTLKHGGGGIPLSHPWLGPGSAVTNITAIGGGGSGGSGGYVADLTPPPAPTNLEANPVLGGVILTWDDPVYTVGHGHAYTEVWRFDADQRGNAIRIAMVPGAIAHIEQWDQTTYYYWLRFVTRDGVAGDFNAAAGVPATAAQNPAYLLDLLTDAIDESHLIATLRDRIDLIDGPDSAAGSVNARILAEAHARATAILNEAAARDAAILSEANLRISGDAAEATQRNALAVQMRGNYTGTDIAMVGAGLLYEERVARANQDGVLAGQISALSATVGSNTAAITAEATARANADSALASSITTLQASVTGLDGDVIALETASAVQASAITGLQAQWTVRIDNNGRVAGIGLASGAGGTSEFAVVADKFTIAPPGGTTIGAAPFFHLTTPTTINGVSVPAGTYMQSAYIPYGVINNLHFDRASGNKIAVVNADIVSVSANKLTAGSIAVGQYIESTNYVSGSQGWRISDTGIEISNGMFRGSVAIGTTGFSTGTGVWEGLVGGTPRWRVGNPAGARAEWDGTTFNIYSASNQLALSAGQPVWSQINGKPADAQLLNSYVPRTNNLLRNADCRTSSDGWYASQPAGTTCGRNHSTTWALPGEGTLWMTEGATDFDPLWYQPDIPVVAGKRYEFTVYSGAHRCLAQIIIGWRNASGTNIGADYGAIQNDAELAGGSVLSSYKRIGGFAVAPAGAVSAVFHLHKAGTKPGETTSYAFFCRPYFGEATANQTDFSPWTPGGNGPGVIQPGNPISSGNADTYIADLTVGTLKIKDAAVSDFLVYSIGTKVANSGLTAVVSPYPVVTVPHLTTLVVDLSGTLYTGNTPSEWATKGGYHQCSVSITLKSDSTSAVFAYATTQEWILGLQGTGATALRTGAASCRVTWKNTIGVPINVRVEVVLACSNYAWFSSPTYPAQLDNAILQIHTIKK